MKRNLLLFAALGILFSGFAQNQKFRKMDCSLPDKTVFEPAPNKAQAIMDTRKAGPAIMQTENDRALTFVEIGEAGNAYGFYGNNRTYLWADNHTNSVVFTHRMSADPPTSYGTSRVAYDISTGKGEAGTWVNNIQVYDPTGPGSTYPMDAGRYPQGGILNPYGNTNPDNAYYTYFIPTIDNSNGSSIWGGYAYGVNQLTQTDPPAPTQTNVTSSGDYYRNVPDAFTITQKGTTWMIDGSYPDGLISNYEGQFIFNKGVYNEETSDIEYEEWLMDILDAGDGINDIKVAFDPSGEIGYLLVMSDSPSDPVPFTSYHPILYQTIDGGETWSENPIHCQLGGEDGIEAIVNYLPDEILEAIYGAGFVREEIPYNMGFHADMSIDYLGNAHLTGLLSCASDDGWYPNPDVMGTFHIWYDKQTGMWDAHLLYMNRTFDGDLGGIETYNRPQISSDQLGKSFFFSFIDTDQEDVTDNISPDLYFAYFSLATIGGPEHGEVQNVTSFTQAMWTAYYASQSHYVFSECLEGGFETKYTIPFVYQAMDPADPGAPVTFWYMDGYELTLDVICGPIGIDEGNTNPIATVEQNSPNPFSANTSINVNLETQANLSLEVVNMIGQKVFEMNKGQVQSGTHTFEISAKNMKSGIYFYTVKANENTITKKMIVE
jgi:type IX secretion system substrate protein